MAVEYAYDLSSNAAPDYYPYPAPRRVPQKRPQPKPQLHKVGTKRVVSREKEKAANIIVLKFFAVVVLGVVALSIVCSSFSAVRNAKASEKKALNNLKIYQSKQIEIDAELARLVTPDKITKIAVEKLGMIKVPEENKIYVSSNEKNKIIVSSEKEEQEEKEEKKEESKKAKTKNENIE